MMSGTTIRNRNVLFRCLLAKTKFSDLYQARYDPSLQFGSHPKANILYFNFRVMDALVDLRFCYSEVTVKANIVLHA
jgi:hypothetical protein